MSKFLKALEQAERDRQLASRSPEAQSAPVDRPPPSPGGASAPPAAGVATAPARAEPPAIPNGGGVRAEPTDGPRPAPPRPAPRPERHEPDSGEGIDDRLVSLLHPGAFEAEQYHALRYAVEKAHRTTGLAVIAVSSPTMGDGKTTTAINVAGALAQAHEARVLLVDADLRNPSVAGRLGLRAGAAPTLADLVLDPSMSIEDAIQPCRVFNLSVIAAGEPSRGSYELFKAPRLGELLADARSRFDFVILDTPPLVHVLDARVLGRWVDGYLIVVACHRTSRELLAEALGVMEPEKVIGLVFNGEDRQPVNHRYHTRYGAPPRRPRATGLSWIQRRRSGER
ncbi:MAG TPA: polysaccharide biosynthesis tyrosine autokinase [Candidatus Binatia bacterium]|nr:polysaccharide biosynthesis tyrosine autokinase [Candidatus Binatia bacterium]